VVKNIRGDTRTRSSCSIGTLQLSYAYWVNINVQHWGWFRYYTVKSYFTKKLSQEATKHTILFLVQDSVQSLS